MPLYFFDTSALIKRYVNETGSAWVESIADPSAGNEAFVSGITELELVSAVVRRARGGSIPAADVRTILSQFRHDLAFAYQVLDVTPALLQQALRHAEAHALRASDAIQLAAAILLAAAAKNAALPAPILVSADRELNAAATAEGLAVEDPNARP